MLSDAELQNMRATQEEDLPETVYIQARTSTDNGAGGQQLGAWSTVATCKGRIGAVGNSPAERIIAARLANVTPYVVTLPAGTEVDESSQLQIGGRQFVVHGVPKHSRNTALRVVVSEVK